MVRSKRSATEAELDMATDNDIRPHNSEQDDVLQRLRNMWEFASLMQFIFIFGAAVKIDEDFDIEDLEQECLEPTPSARLAEIGLTLLKHVSSHRGLTQDIFAEYTRRQYIAKAPERNPFGDDEEDATPFNDLDIYTRIQVLQQLSTWTFTNVDRMRALMPEDEDDLNWRIEPLGWDAEDRSYFVLDDNRLYRRTDEPLPPPTPVIKAKSKNKSKVKQKKTVASRATRTSKRRRIDDSSDEEIEHEEEPEQDEDVVMSNGHATTDEPLGYGFTKKTWELLAITLEEYQEFLASIRKSRDANEKTLRTRIESDVLPIIEKRAEALRAKEMKKLRELEALQKMATAKRSSRLADKAERSAKEQEERDAEEKRTADLRMARLEQDRQRRIEEGHESRRLTREQRLKEREVKRILHEEELQRIEREASAVTSQPDSDLAQTNGVRLSSRNLQIQREAHRKELDRLEQDQEEDKWYFDCVVCGMHGENLDDGSHSVACERCNVWQHSKCHGFTPEQSEREDFHFVCKSCQKAERAAQATKDEQRSGLVLKLGKRNVSESPKPSTSAAATSPSAIKKENVLPDYIQKQLAGIANSNASPERQQLPHDTQAGQQYRPPQANMIYDQGVQHITLQPQRQNGTVHSSPVHAAQQQGYYVSATQHQTQSHADQHNWIHNRAVNGAGGHPAPVLPSYPQTYQGQAASHSTPMRPLNVQPSMQAFSSQARSLQARPFEQTFSTAPHPQHSRPAITPSPQYGSRSIQPQLNGSPSGQGTLPFQTPQAVQTPYQQKPTPSNLQQSPHTAIPPPSTEYNKQAAISPEKSSPPRQEHHPGLSASTSMNGHAISAANTVERQGMLSTPNASFDNAPKLATPNKSSASPMEPERLGDSLAASGMRGPWPTGSMAVPQKADIADSSPAR